MESAIDDLFFRQYDLDSQVPNEERKNAEREAEEKERVLLELIKDNDKAVRAFKMYQIAESCIPYRESSYYFKQGFRQGFRIAVDGLKEE